MAATRKELLESIAELISDYREGEVACPTVAHVNRWVKQFDADAQEPILAEMVHVLDKTYFPKKSVVEFLEVMATHKKVAGDAPEAYWSGIKFLRIQDGGNSQKSMLSLFAKVLKEKFGLTLDTCGTDAGPFFYLDDALFTGNRLLNDFRVWLADGAPKKSTVHAITIACHTGGWQYAHKNVQKAAANNGKTIDLTGRACIQLANAWDEKDKSDVLWPTALPDDPDVAQYEEMLKAAGYPPQLRTPGGVGSKAIFSSDAGRQVLEQQFLKYGAQIKRMCPQLNEYMRPLGNCVMKTLGFGTLIVTYRNCPNNCPLALWADDPWYPLFPRRTNTDTSIKQLTSLLGRWPTGKGRGNG